MKENTNIIYEEDDFSALPVVTQFGAWELKLKAQKTVDYKYHDVECPVSAKIYSPSGKKLTVKAFWDGGNIWKIRFSPDKTGIWKWETSSASGEDAGFQRNGEFECIKYEGNNQLFKHGPLSLSKDRKRLVHKDGFPFFWLGDTAWNGVIRGDDENWGKYLKIRAKQGFSVIQFVASHWRGDALDEFGEAGSSDEIPIRINPAFFQRLDKRIAKINEYGLIAAPVVLWSLLESDLGYKLPEEEAIRLASYIISRYNAYQVVWILGGDGNYQKIGLQKWKNIGRKVHDLCYNRLITLHPCGQNWIGEEFRNEDWYNIIGYQSGHGDGEDDLRWLVQGPPATKWKKFPALPIINLEPNYETAYGYQHQTVFTDYHVRRAAYWSLLISPTAGITYGHDAIWNWNFETGPSEGHGDWHRGKVPPWHTGLDTPGIKSMTVLREIFERIDWASLTPCQWILAEQPGLTNIESFVVAAKDAIETLVIYSPLGGTIKISSDAVLKTPLRIVDPRTGNVVSVTDQISEKSVIFPDNQDWLAVFGTAWKEK